MLLQTIPRRKTLNVTIQERKISFTSEYDITAPGASYYARKAFFSFNDHLELQEQGGHVVAVVQGSFSPLEEKHDFKLSDGRDFHFRCAALWKRVFLCIGADASYTLYEHKGLRCSIFREDRQVAAFQKNRVVFGKGNEYEIQMDSDADLLVIVCMVLTMNMAEDNDKDSTVTVDLGRIGPEARQFDEAWEPR